MPDSHFHPAARDACLPRPIHWGVRDARLRGPIIGFDTENHPKNVAGSHFTHCAIPRAITAMLNGVDLARQPDLENTYPKRAVIRPNSSWFDPNTIVTLDPFGHLVPRLFAREIAGGATIWPTISMTTKANIDSSEIRRMINADQLKPDGKVLLEDGRVPVTEISIDPVWHLPGVASRLGMPEETLRRTLYTITENSKLLNPKWKVYLPPIDGTTVFVFGDPLKLADPSAVIACRWHDQCTSSDVFKSDVCTCEPYLTHGVNVCIETAQQGGVGVIIYGKKEGRWLGEVTKLLVYMKRKTGPEADVPEKYFERTKEVVGFADARLQMFMPDTMRWLGIGHVDKWLSMSKDKYEAVTAGGIRIRQEDRVPLPEHMVPDGARTEITAKTTIGGYLPLAGHACG